ncbi:MAG TPA: GspMb/PilO family protein [Pyrinomonadaceae bacterium]
MSAEVQTEPQTPNGARRQYNQRVSQFVGSRRGKMFGIAEVAALAVSCFVLLLVLLSYLYFYVPARARIASLNRDRQQLQTNLAKLGGIVDKGNGTQQQVDKVSASLNKFESDNLLRPDQGRMELYDELNQLILKNSLRNTSGPTYTTLDPAGSKAAAGKSVVTKWQSFYPGIAVTVTVEGEYQNVRHFIQDMERSKQFVVINQVELQRAQQNNAPASADDDSVPSTGTRGSQVSLQLNMATYFLRESEAEAAAGQN